MKFDNGVILSYTKLRTLVLKLSYPLRGATKWSLFDHLTTCCLSGHDPRMGRRISVGVLFAVLCFFTACDSSSSSADPDPIAEVSSSGGGDEVFSSSSVTDKRTSSGESSKSSSSVKPDSNGSQKSSSSGKKNNSSSSEGGVVSSSSSDSEIICNDGDLDTLRSGLYIIYRKCENGTWVKDHYDVLSASSSSSSDAHYDMTEQYYCNGSLDNCENMSDDYIDPRDQHVYKTFLYQKEKNGTYLYRFRIFASNLNYGKQIMSDVVNSNDNVVEKYCYNDDEWYCDNGFGGMYTWSEAMGLPKACDSLFVDSSAACKDSFVPPEGRIEKLGEHVQRQGVCPEGWHIMNEWEWLQFSGWSGGALASSILWTATNVTGFSALPVGSLNDGKFESFGMLTLFWIPQEKSESNAMMHEVDSKYQMNGTPSKHLAASIRCVEDYEDSRWK